MRWDKPLSSYLKLNLDTTFKAVKSALAFIPLQILCETVRSDSLTEIDSL